MDRWVGVDLGGGWSDTGHVRRNDESARADVAPQDCGEGVSRSVQERELGHEFGFESQFKSGFESGMNSEVGAEVGRGLSELDAGFADLELGVDGDGGGVDAEVVGARMFAHEVNNLAMAVSGRAQRGLLSGDDDHVRAALKVAADVGSRVAGLCALFLERQTEDIQDRTICLDVMQIVSVHEFARSCVSCHPVMVAWAERSGEMFEVNLGEGVFGVDGGRGAGGVPMPGMLLGQVLVNLYGNALTGIGRLSEMEGVDGWRDEDGFASGAWIRLGGGVVAGGGVELVVEDSGIGFVEGSGEDGQRGGGSVFGGYGLGLGVCRALVGGFGGRVELGRSAELGGGLVRLIFAPE